MIPSLAEARERLGDDLAQHSFRDGGDPLTVVKSADLRALLTTYDEMAGTIKRIAESPNHFPCHSDSVVDPRSCPVCMGIAFLSTVKPIQGSLRREDAPSAEAKLAETFELYDPAVKWERHGDLLYTLHQDRWEFGKPMMANRLELRITFNRRADGAEQDAGVLLTNLHAVLNGAGSLSGGRAQPGANPESQEPIP